MTIIEYILSATDQAFPFNDTSKEIVEGALQVSKILQDDVKAYCKHYDPQISLLYNAYTEKKLTERFKAFDNLGLSNVYADSGGLQIITRGKEITEKIKDQVYADQIYADYGMCFDVIPITKTAGIKRTRNERSNFKTRIFHSDDHKNSGKLTGINIKRQIEIYQNLDAKTKVMLIVQGNTYHDMLDYYHEIIKQLKPEDYDHIGGLAISGACMGSGELESIEILRAAHLIAKEAHPNVAQHFHMLGIGSIKRMTPVINLLKSKYLTFPHISYDSSSHTSTFTYGLLKVNGGCTALGKLRTQKNEKHFENVYGLFEKYLKNRINSNEFLDIVLGKKGNLIFGETPINWTPRSILDRDSGPIGKLVVTLHTYFQINNFIKCLDNVWNMKFTGDPMSNLLNVKDDKDMQEWTHFMSSQLSSKRIHRKSSTLEGFYATK